MKFFGFVFLLVFSINVFAQEKTSAEDGKNTGLIYGKDHVFTLTAPKGWVLDNKSGVSQGLFAVFFPEGSSWSKGTAVMYANVYHKTKITEETVDTVIAADIADFKTESPKLQVVDAPSLPTRKAKTATVRYFSGDIRGNFEAIGYMDEGKVVVMIVLSGRTKADFETSLPAFEELVSSYVFLGDKVTAMPKK